MRVSVLRQLHPGSAPYWETFEYHGSADNSVAGVLDCINYHDDIVNAEGVGTTRIGWECSCLQGICGACAMVINGKPALACETFVRDLNGKDIEIRPLRKFPVIHDLVVDRTSIHENLKQANVCIGEYRPSADADHAHQYAAAKCLKCGLCLEVCPNYVNGHTFFGAAFANDCYLVASRNRAEGGRIRALYAEHFGKTCSKSLSCMEVCPMRIMYVTGMIGGALGIFLAYITADYKTVPEYFASPRVWQYFLYHAMVVTLGLYLGFSGQHKASLSHWKYTMVGLVVMDFPTFYLNSIFSQPVYTDSKPVGLIYRANFFSSYVNPLGLVLSQKWQWLLYLVIRLVIAVIVVTFLLWLAGNAHRKCNGQEELSKQP